MSGNRLVVNSNFFSRNNHLSSLIYWNHYRDTCISASGSLPLYTGLVWDYSSHKSWDAAWRSLTVLDGPWRTSASWEVAKGVHIVFIFNYFHVYKCACLSVSVPHGCSASWGQKRVLGPLERGVNKSLWASVLGTKLFYIFSQNLICTFCHSFIGFLSLLKGVIYPTCSLLYFPCG